LSRPRSSERLATRRIVGTAAGCNGPLGYDVPPRIAGPAQGWSPLHRARKLQGSLATPTMPPLEHAPHAWARLRVDTNCALRRGAWYRVLRLTRDQAVLQVTREPVPVERRLVQTVFQPPTRWSVVPRPQDAARVPEQWGTRYAVCPACHGRAPLNDFPREMRCPHCRGTFEIAWDEHYLKRR
jgi:hypothetical protein